MKRNLILLWIALASFPAWFSSLQAQSVAPSAVAGLVRAAAPTSASAIPYNATSAASYSTPPIVMIKNRARTLGNDTIAGTRYFAATLTNSDIVGKTPEQVLNLLTPAPVTATDGVRRVQVLLDLTQTRPLTLFGEPGEPVSVGTLVVQAAGLKQIEVNTNIFSNGLIVAAR